MKTTHLTRLTCACGNETEVPAAIGHGETESFGSVYGYIKWAMPDGWSYADCPKCRVPVSASDAYDEETINGGEP